MPASKTENGLRETPAVKLHELLGQSSRRLLALYLEDHLEVLRYLSHPGGRHVREDDIALEVYGTAPLPLGAPGNSPATAAFLMIV